MAMSQNLLVKNFKRVKDIYEFDEGFIKSSHNNVIHIINLRQTLNHELVLKKLRRVIKFKGLVKIIYG